MSGVYLSNRERLDLKGVLLRAESALKYPMLSPSNEPTVRALREAIDWLTTDDERAWVAGHLARLHANPVAGQPST